MVGLNLVEVIGDYLRFQKNKVIDETNYTYVSVAREFAKDAKDQWFEKDIPQWVGLAPFKVNFRFTRLDIEGVTANQRNRMVNVSLFDGFKVVLPPSGEAYTFEILGNRGLERVSYYKTEETEAVPHGVGLHEAGNLLEVVLFPPGYNPKNGYTLRSVKTSDFNAAFDPKRAFSPAIGEVVPIQLHNIDQTFADEQALKRDITGRVFRRVWVQKTDYWEVVQRENPKTQ